MSPETKAKRAARMRAYRMDPEKASRMLAYSKKSRDKRAAEIKSGKRAPPECLSSEYVIWNGIIQRCTNPKNCNYHSYGARGISVSDRWRVSYAAFLSDMGRKPFPGAEIDRIDNSGNYEPSNCRWATRQRNSRNTRRTRFVSWGGKEMSLSDWADEVGLPASVIRQRLDNGWSADEALTTKVEKCSRRAP